MTRTARLRGVFCGLPCVEMTIVASRGGTVRVEGGCPACRSAITPEDLDERARPRVAGRRTTLDAAILAAARTLQEARSPFVYGLSQSVNAAARGAAALAAALGGALDIEGSDRLLPDLTALQSFGLPSATFGEIRNRADVLLLWRADPRASHPWLFEKAAGTPLEAAPARTVILAGPAAEAQVMAPDLVLRVADGGDLEALLGLRALVRGRAPGREHLGGVPIADLRSAAARLSKARYAAVLWDGTAVGGPAAAAIASALVLLARDLNASGRCAARPLGGGNSAGATATLLGLTGAPWAIGFASGRPRWAPGEYDAARMIGGAAADVLLLIGARSLPPRRDLGGSRAPSGAPRRVIVVGPRLPREAAADIVIPTALPGIAAGGSSRRADGLPVVLRAVWPSSRPREEDVLEAILASITSGRRAAG